MTTPCDPIVSGLPTPQTDRTLDADLRPLCRHFERTIKNLSSWLEDQYNEVLTDIGDPNDTLPHKIALLHSLNKNLETTTVRQADEISMLKSHADLIYSALDIDESLPYAVKAGLCRERIRELQKKDKRIVAKMSKDSHLRERIICKDGTSLSVQASQYHYCSPRISTKDLASYTAVEVGFPEDKDGNRISIPEFFPYTHDHEQHPDVYSYVPLQLVEKFIQDHGGQDDEPTT